MPLKPPLQATSRSWRSPTHPPIKLPVAELAGKMVIDTNNYMVWRDGNIYEVDVGEKTMHEHHVQFHKRSPMRVPDDAQPAVVRLSRPLGAPDRKALVVSSNHPSAVDLVVRFYDDLGFDAVDNSPLSESWRSAPGTPMWATTSTAKSREELILNLERAQRILG